MTYKIALPASDRLQQLYSYPNDPDAPAATLAETIQHWFDLTLQRDGFAAQGATAKVLVEGDDYYLELNGPDALAGYTECLTRFLAHGQSALAVIEQLKTAKPEKPWPEGLPYPTDDKVWDPQNTGQWRFFLPLGMAMLQQRSLQFFHYPPVRLLTGTQDYLDDPVPVRWKELLAANGVSEQQNPLFNVVVDGAPIAAPDDQGTQYINKDGKTEAVHLIPIESFHDYQRRQTELLLQADSGSDDFTIPIVVYGTPARETFSALWGEQHTNKATRVEIIQGKQTAVAAVGHPYRFYAACQSEVGSGSILPEKCRQAIKIMREDLAVARWQVLMANNPALEPQALLDECTRYWNDPAQQAVVCQLVQHQGSLWYPDPDNPDPKKALAFEFKVSMTQAGSWCEQHGNNPCAGNK